MISTVEEMIETYVVAWNNDNLKAFKTAFSTCWADDATYTDPNFELVKGVDDIAALAQFSLEKIPGRKFYVQIQPEYHHHYGRYTWKVVLPDGEKEGVDFFEYGDDFKITRIVSFFPTV